MKNLVITGFGGGEYGARGYISALDQNTGKEVWRFWTVPGPGEPGNDTWKGDSWKFGGGHGLAHRLVRPGAESALLRHEQSLAVGRGRSAVRDSSNYGNAHQPLLVLHARHQSRTPASSCGTTRARPHDAWDYDGVNELVLADLSDQRPDDAGDAQGRPQRLLLRPEPETGKLLSAKSFVPINWATGVDMATGRPIEVADKRPRFKFRAKDICPNLLGGKNWHADELQPADRPRVHPVHQPVHGHGGRRARLQARHASTSAFEFDLGKSGPGGYMSELMAWDPVKQQKVWGNKDALPWLGGHADARRAGSSSTATCSGWFKALDARTGPHALAVPDGLGRQRCSR